MYKKAITITLLIISIAIVSIYIVKATYSLIINVIDREGEYQILEPITIKELITDEYGGYDNNYYEAKKELDITEEEANIIIESEQLNEVLNILLNNVVSYRLNGKNRLTNNQIIDLITTAVNSDETISEELKTKIINTTRENIADISTYLYDIKTSKDTNQA